MRILVEAVIRGELATMELSEQDFCPECCGTLEIAGAGDRAYLRCTSCYLALRPKRPDRPGPAGEPA
jgi:tRNA(Ile2) C34 agmatinyltransferase TiaS